MAEKRYEEINGKRIFIPNHKARPNIVRVPKDAVDITNRTAHQEKAIKGKLKKPVVRDFNYYERQDRKWSNKAK
jgi:hypothetical protein